MIKKYRQFIIGLLVGAILFASIPAFADTVQYIFTQSNCKLIIDGQGYSNPDIPIVLFMKDGINYAPMAVIRDLCLQLNTPFEYNDVTKEIRIITRKEKASTNTNATMPDPVKSYNENNLLLIEVNNVKYVEIHTLKAQLEDLGYHLYLGGIHCTLQDMNKKDISDNILLQERFRDGLYGKTSFDFMGREFILYDDYLNKIKPLIKE